MANQKINVLLTSFPGLNLPSTLSLPLPADSSINDLTTTLSSHFPNGILPSRLILTTTSNHQLNPTSTAPLTTLLSTNPSTQEQQHQQPCTLLPLRLSTRLCGGKGGFGSQLRAAGGRMQSRKKRASGPTESSNRALGGPRFRVIAEAKALSEYYATQPERERKAKEEKRRRWEAVIEAAERKQDEIRRGKGGGGGQGGKGGRLDGKWMESKEEGEEKMREAVRRAVESGEVRVLGREGSDVSVEGSSEGRSESEREDDDDDGEGVAQGSKGGKGKGESEVQQSRTFFGWDEDEDMSSDEEDEDMGSDGEDDDDIPSHEAPVLETTKGKGKAKA